MFDYYAESPGFTNKCQRAITVAPVLVALAAFVGCNSVISLHPLHDNEHSVTDSRLLGEWQTKTKVTPPEVDEPSWRVSKKDETTYKLTVQWSVDEDAPQTQIASKQYLVKLVRLGGHLYADVFPYRVLDMSAPERFEPLLISGHCIFKCSFDEDSMSVWPLARKNVEGFVKKLRGNVPYSVVDGNLVLSADTRHLQHFVHNNREKVFSEKPIVFRRTQQTARNGRETGIAPGT